MNFEEVFAEPEGTYSFGTIWGASFRVFTDTKLWCYRFLSAACAVPCALCWGVHFACLGFSQIWVYTPTLKSFSIQIIPVAKAFSLCAKSFIAPCFEAFGKLFSGIRIHRSVDWQKEKTELPRRFIWPRQNRPIFTGICWLCAINKHFSCKR